MKPLVLGVDPGPVPGVALRRPDGPVEVLQVSPGTLTLIVRALVASAPPAPYGGPNAVLAVEKFVVGRRATRSATPAAGALTRNQIGALEALAVELGIPCFLRSASEVKPWSSDQRLSAAGVTAKGMPHGKDAARHTLYCSVHDCGYPDPLARTVRP